ncbi:putative retroelement [Hordeum vulgare]|nr:putative retroelement [Hordeum vulgare]
MLHIRDVEGPKKSGSVETRLEAMEQQVFKCQGMVERGLNANHMMITEFTSKHKMDAIDIGKHLSRLYDRVDQLQGQIYDLQNQNCTPPWLNSMTLIALTDHWRSETHSFHLALGEMTITLEHIAMITGLPIKGRALTGKDIAPTNLGSMWYASSHPPYNILRVTCLAFHVFPYLTLYPNLS